MFWFQVLHGLTTEGRAPGGEGKRMMMCACVCVDINPDVYLSVFDSSVQNAPFHTVWGAPPHCARLVHIYICWYVSYPPHPAPPMKSINVKFPGPRRRNVSEYNMTCLIPSTLYIYVYMYM